ncbi:solute carrier family 2, facilitated glucose transporter member 8-like [Limulus polyphemus]|uniref:Solute carrier family 2, facilitated glucose transporter member 8-like n=1 Tax=Limulus polyphemus TaxID=6850 RepID=A0ABM1B5E6_LIMPO|nr:solute carrier family 2, facilitated glucose transporter member 8-like [Limulus polyphemus]
MESNEISLVTQTDNRKFRKFYLAAVAALFGSISMGTGLGYSSPAIPSLQSVNSNVHLSDADIPWFGSLLAIGALIGGPIAGFAIDYFGRKLTLMLIPVVFIAGWLCMIFSHSTGLLLFGRIVTGFSCGLVSLAVPVYIAETAAPDSRGLLGSCVQLMITLGILLTYVVGKYIEWKWLALFSMTFPAILTILMIFVPETPRWLLSNGKRGDAIKAIDFLYGSSLNAEAECQILESNISQQTSERLSWRVLLLPHVLKPLFLSLGLMIFQQLSGINNVMFYTVSIFQSTGSAMDPNDETIIIGVVLFLATLAGSLLMDLAGRRILLLVSAFVMAFSLAVLGTYYYLDETVRNSYNWLPLTSMIVYIAAFSIGYGPIPWLMMGELFSVKVRGWSSGIATFVNWTFVFLVTKEFHFMIELVHEYGAYWIFGSLCLLSCVFVATVVPETKGKTLEEIENYFQAKKQLLHSINASDNDLENI